MERRWCCSEPAWRGFLPEANRNDTRSIRHTFEAAKARAPDEAGAPRFGPIFVGLLLQRSWLIPSAELVVEAHNHLLDVRGIIGIL